MNTDVLKYEIPEVLDSVHFGVRVSSEAGLSTSGIFGEKVNCEKVSEIQKSRKTELAELASGSAIIQGKAKTGKSSLVLAAIHQQLQNTDSETSWDTFYINFGIEGMFGAIGMPKFFTQQQKKYGAAGKAVDEAYVKQLLDAGKCYDTFHWDGTSQLGLLEYDGLFAESMLNEPRENSIYIFDEIQWTGVLPEKAQQYLLNDVLKKFSQVNGSKVYIISVNEPDQHKWGEYHVPPKYLDELTDFKRINLDYFSKEQEELINKLVEERMRQL